MTYYKNPIWNQLIVSCIMWAIICTMFIVGYNVFFGAGIQLQVDMEKIKIVNLMQNLLCVVTGFITAKLFITKSIWEDFENKSIMELIKIIAYLEGLLELKLKAQGIQIEEIKEKMRQKAGGIK